ncbi:hypothetical protein ACFE04_011766 [Oxalis oulophora]
MNAVLSTTEQEGMISSFLDITTGQTTHTARKFLQFTNWQLDDAIGMFYMENDNKNNWDNNVNYDHSRRSSYYNSANQFYDDFGNVIRAPLPVVRNKLYDHDDADVFNSVDQAKHSEVWESNSQPQLASLYQPPYQLMFHGSFDKAKCASSAQNKWLIVNLQSVKEFSSHTLNRDTWANDAVSQIISTNFMFWQVYDDTTEGQKVSTYYKLTSFPVVLVIDPITGQQVRSWSGMIQPESFLEDLVPFIDRSPMDHVAINKRRPRDISPPTQREISPPAKRLKVPNEEVEKTLPVEEATPIQKPVMCYPLPSEEPKVDRKLLCRVGIRLPDGRRVQRSFLRTDPIQLLWSFSYSQLEEIERKPFQLAQQIPGTATKYLDYDSKLTFGESGLANSMISIIRD